jgi:hypothetical protein
MSAIDIEHSAPHRAAPSARDARRNYDKLIAAGP